jgi:subtilase family serine protease
MYLAHGARVLAAGALGLSVLAAGGTSAAAATAAATGAAPQAVAGTAAAGRSLAVIRAQAAAGDSVVITPGVRRPLRESDGGPSTTAECEQSLQIACYNPAQLQQAYGLNALYSRGITGKGATIVIVEPYGSPTIASDLRAFDRAESVPNPPSLRIIRPLGKVPHYNPGNPSMVGWAGETTLDVEYAHTIAPGAKILLVETPGGGAQTATVGMSQILLAEKYVIRHHLGDVISQSFGATEQAVGSAAIRSLRGAYTAAYANHITVLAASGDTGAAGFEADQQTFYTHAVTSWPASDPLVTAVGGTRLDLDASGNRNSADTVWNDTYDQNANQLADGSNGPNPLSTGGGKSVVFARPSYQGKVRGITGSHRGVPDISMSAACSATVNVYQTFRGEPAGWYAVCGTSESSPLFSGIVALADQVAGHRLGLINPALYRLAAQHAPGLVGIRSGNNTVSFRQGGKKHTVRGYRAWGGYSLATGLGTINAQLFVPELARAAG